MALMTTAMVEPEQQNDAVGHECGPVDVHLCRGGNSLSFLKVFASVLSGIVARISLEVICLKCTLSISPEPPGSLNEATASHRGLDHVPSRSHIFCPDDASGGGF